MNKIYIPFCDKLNTPSAKSIENVLEEAGATGLIECVNWADLFPYKPVTFFKIARSADTLFIKYSVKGNVLRAVYSNDQEPVWQDSCVEFFCKRTDEAGYTNFEFNCIGTCLSARHTSREVKVSRPPEEMNRILRYPSLGKRTFKEMEGMFSWELTVGIPFTLLDIDPDHLPEKMLGNFYKCADGTALKHYVSWSPIHTPTPDFHRPEFFGELIFA